MPVLVEKNRQAQGTSARKRFTRDSPSATFTASASKGRPRRASRSRSRDDNSSRQGAHQVAQKFTSSTLPR